MDAAYLFARNLINVNYKDIPQDAVEATKREILDILGVAVGGSAKPGVRELREIVAEWGGKEESTVLCYGDKVPAPNAAQVNATMAHALDYDDTHEPAGLHPAVVIVPTCLALAERRGKFSGQEFITAVALGSDMVCRLGLAIRLGISSSPGTEGGMGGWHLTTVNGFLAAAGTAGRILGLDEEGILNALGIAYHQCSGSGTGVEEGALTKRMGPGFATRAGIVSALMAEKGITGPKNSLEARGGFLQVYYQGNYDARALTADLGKHFEGADVAIKPYPCCRGVHFHIDAALALLNKHKIKAEDVQEVTIYAPERHGFLCLPQEAKIYPRNIVDSQFSIPWGVAVAIARGRATIEDFTEEAIKSRDILEVCHKIKLEMDPGLDRWDTIPGGIVKIKTKSGEEYSERVDDALGSPQRPLTASDSARKFKDCASYAIKKLPDEHIDRVINLVGKLEQVDDITEIIKLLS
jgi:2-methylcitrate dehydratase PrpD